MDPDGSVAEVSGSSKSRLGVEGSEEGVGGK